MIHIVTPDKKHIRRIQKAENAFYWSRLAELTFRKHGYVATTGQDGEAETSLPVYLRQGIVAPNGGPALFEGPLEASALQKLGLSAHQGTADKVYLKVDSTDVLSPGKAVSPHGSTLVYPSLKVRRIPQQPGETSDPYTFQSRDPRWNNRRIGFQWFEADNTWVPLAWLWTEQDTTPRPAIVTDGKRMVLGVPLFDLLAAYHCLPYLDAGFYNARISGLIWAFQTERSVFGLMESLCQASGLPCQRTPAWPEGKHACLTVRHDYDRPITDSRLADILRFYKDRGILATWFILPQRPPTHAQLRAMLENGHELALHSTAPDPAGFAREIAEFRSLTGFSPSGYSVHGGRGSRGYLGQGQQLWAEENGMLYGEQLDRICGIPIAQHKCWREMPEQGALILPNMHRGLDIGMAPNSHQLDFLQRELPGMLTAGEHVIPMNHPDIHWDEFRSLLDGLDLRSTWTATLEQACAWTKHSKFAENSQPSTEHSPGAWMPESRELTPVPPQHPPLWSFGSPVQKLREKMLDMFERHRPRVGYINATSDALKGLLHLRTGQHENIEAPAPHSHETTASLRFDADAYTLVANGTDIRIRTQAGTELLSSLTLSYSTCTVGDINEPLSRTDCCELQDTSRFHASDRVLALLGHYGGTAAKHNNTCHTVSKVEGNRVWLSPHLPKHFLTNSQSLVLIKRPLPPAHVGLEAVELHPVPEGAELLCRAETEHFTLFLTLHLRQQSPTIVCTVRTVYKKDTTLFHLSLCMTSAQPVRHVYLKNRTRVDFDSSGPKTDIWLGHEGIQFGNEEGQLVIHHTPKAGFSELITPGEGLPEKTVRVRDGATFTLSLEHILANRFRRQTECTNGFHTYQDRSAPQRHAGQETTATFHMHAGQKLTPVPRFMAAPGGYRAVHVWTEHADNALLETHRAAHLGHSATTTACDARSGMAGQRHRVTKTIFHDNRVGCSCLTNNDIPSPRPMISYTQDEAFRSLLDDLHGHGHEICLHNAAPNNSTRAMEAEALDEIAGRYGSHVWVDHTAPTNRTCMSAEGLLPESASFMADLWKAHGIRYFWTPSSEDFAPKRKTALNLLHEESGPYTPTPLHWRVPGHENDFRIWAANECGLEAFTRESLDRLVQQRGVSIHHHYYPFVCPEQYDFGFIEPDGRGGWRVTERFNEVLRHMTHLRLMGELCITTVGELMDYWTALERISYAYDADGSVVITNSGPAVPGLACVLRARSVESQDVRILSRPLEDGDLLAWFDAPENSRTRLIIET